MVMALAAHLREGGERVDLIETHISYVLLTKHYAYKIKKAVNLQFLDFTTLAARRLYCMEELRLNRRYAPQLYLDVVPIGGSWAQPRIEGAEPALDYAVKMQTFPQDQLADRLLAHGDLSAADLDALAHTVAAFHTCIARAGADTTFGAPERVLAPALQNFDQMQALECDAANAMTDRLRALRDWSIAQYTALSALMAERKRAGFVRECHGDLHLGNIARVEDTLTPFDGIDFNPELRWIDTSNEVAFLVMDLEFRQRADLAYRFLNTYLEITGDYQAVALLRFYQVYRALVRAKVALLRAAQSDDARQRADAVAHLDYAAACAKRCDPAVILTHGLAGSGKTTATYFLCALAGAIRIRSDIERKRLHGIGPLARTDSAVAAGIYGAEASARTYQKLLKLAQVIVGAGYPVIVDAAFLKRAEREQFRAFAEHAQVPFFIADFRAPPELLRERIRKRQQDAGDASEADLAVLEFQLQVHEGLSAEEQSAAIAFDCTTPAAATAMAAAWGPVLARLGDK